MQDTSSAHELVGVWKLESIQFEFEDSRERMDMYGPSPLGYMILTESGRAMVLVTASDRSPPNDDASGANLFKSIMSYTGNYRVDGDRFVTHIDVAWHPGWMGTDQTRRFRLEDDRLSIITDTQTHPMFGTRKGRGIIIWSRA